MVLNYKDYQKIANEIKKELAGFEPEIGIVLGSDFEGFEKRIEKKTTLFYKDIPGFLPPSAKQSDGRLIFGCIKEKKIVCLVGRNHYYEGCTLEELSIPTRILKLLGIKKLITTNIAGAINTSYSVGDVMIIEDHINLTGENALRGPNVDEFGPRFPDMSQVYSREMIRVAEECAKEVSLTVRKGVYFFFAGPQFETPAEIRAARILGGDAAGMSTVNEVQVASHCGIPVLGLSLISNMAAGVLDVPISISELNASLTQTVPLFEAFLQRVAERL